MTTGSIVFYSGVGLFAVTILLAIVFLIRKPQYNPQKAVYDGRGGRKTQSLRSGYPTDPLTVRQEKPSAALSRQEAVEPARRTEPMRDTEKIVDDGQLEKTETIMATAGTKTEKLET